MICSKYVHYTLYIYIPTIVSTCPTSVVLRIDALKEKDLSISRAEDFRRENAQLRRELARPGPRWLEMLASRVPYSLGPKILNQERYNGRKNLDSHECANSSWGDTLWRLEKCDFASKSYVSNRNLLFQESIFMGYVSFRECTLHKIVGSCWTYHFW